MQSSPINPFPLSDSTSDTPTKPLTPVAPMPVVPAAATTNPTTPPATPSAPMQSPIFVQPTAAEPSSASALKGPLGKIEQSLLKVFSHPSIQMPDFVRDMISRFLPWLTLMLCFILAPLLLIGLGMGGFLGFITSFYELNTNAFYWLTIVLLIGQLVLMGMSIPKLLHEKRTGWNLLFIAALLGGLTVATNIFAQFVQPLLGTLVGFATLGFILYILFQVRSYYAD